MTLDKIKELLLDQLNVSEENITMDSRLIEDLGADSLDAVELVMSIEDEFGVSISDDQAKNIKTVGDLVRFVDESK